jgi:Polysaccharide lyase
MAVSALVFSNRTVRWPILAVALATTLVFGCLLASLGDTPAFAEPVSARSTSVLMEPVGIMWKGDASKPLYEQWASISDQEHCSVETGASNLPDSRITLVTDSRFAKGVAIHYHMNPGDKSCFSGRSELVMTSKFGESWPYMITRGHEGWYAFQVLFPTTYPLNQEKVADGGVMQVHNYGGSGNVPFGISAGRLCEKGQGPGKPHEGGPELGYIKAWIKAASPEAKAYCLSKEIHASTIYNILIHAKFTEESSGFVEIFLNGTKVMDYTGSFGFVATANSILRSGLYPDTSRTESPVMDLYEGGWTLASTREAAEANSFGTSQGPTSVPQRPPTAANGSAGVTHSNRHCRSRTMRRHARKHHARRCERSHRRRRRALVKHVSHPQRQGGRPVAGASRVRRSRPSTLGMA